MKLKEPVLLKRVGKMENPASVNEYVALGGFGGIKKAVQMEKEAILQEISDANLRGRGGAAYPMGRKWRHLYEIESEIKYVVCNADEGEPGTFKDKMLLKKDPFSVIEGMLIAGYVFGAKKGYIYIRGEYREIHAKFREALKSAERAGYLGENILGVQGFNYEIILVSGAGSYVCGENSTLLNSIEGKAGRPRVKPPHLAEVGLYQQPTLVNNVESFASIPVILEMGGKNFLSLGTPDGGGTKLICLSGHIKNRGVYEIGLGTPMQDILYSPEFGGGTSTGRPIKFCHLGGQSGPIAFADLLDGEYSYEGMWEKGLAIGSGAIVVLDDSVNTVEYVCKVMEFFVDESCGKCTPCRLGTQRVHELLETFVKNKAKQGDLERLENMIAHIERLSACGLGQSSGKALKSAIKQARAEFEACIQ